MGPAPGQLWVPGQHSCRYCQVIRGGLLRRLCRIVIVLSAVIVRVSWLVLGF